jgi:signal transduction histidine kinase
VALSLKLGMVAANLERDPLVAHRLLTSAREDLAEGLDELRELARGIHPAILTERGLGPALDSLLSRAALPVEVEAVPDERLSPPVEAAAYYIVAEALTNVTKYAGASAATVAIRRIDGSATVVVADDGAGGADPARGSGLRGLTARVEALNGRLTVVSPPGRGTRIEAEIPLG